MAYIHCGMRPGISPFYFNGGDIMKIGFIGAGKAGFTLGKYFCEHDLNVIGYYSKNFQSAAQAAEFTNTKCYYDLKSIVEASDILFLTVPDRAIEEIWECIQKLSIKNKIICHCSGSLSSAVFSNIENHQSYGYSIHPLFAISDKLNSYKEISGAFFTLEGSKEHLEEMKILLEQLGNPVQVISSGSKTIYHCGAVFASNFVVALMQTGMDLLCSCGFDQDSAAAALRPLLLGSVQNIIRQGTVYSLTGPVERCDLGTIKEHLNSIEESEKELYVLLSNKLVEIAMKKNAERDYEELIIYLEKMGVKNEKHCNNI